MVYGLVLRVKVLGLSINPRTSFRSGLGICKIDRLGRLAYSDCLHCPACLQSWPLAGQEGHAIFPSSSRLLALI